EVFNLLIDTNLQGTAISSITGVPLGTIRDISSLVGHLWLAEQYPDRYKVLKSKKGKRVNGRSSAAEKGIQYPKILSPNGDQFLVTNIREFARNNNLDQSALGKVLTGKQKTHKGWQLFSNTKNTNSWNEVWGTEPYAENVVESYEK
ncbi:MAG: hypothetical protein AAB368_11370, partial [bacterium]